MRSLPITMLTFLSVVLCEVPARAQYGLYGSPEVLRLPQPQPAAAPNGGYLAPGAYPAAPVPQSLTTASAPQRESAGARTPSLVDQMLNQQGSGGGSYDSDHTGRGASGPACGDGGGCFGGPLRGFQQAACGSGCGGGCAAGCACPWYASVDALVMTRDKANRVWTTYENGNEVNQLTNTNDVAMGWQWGGEVRIGRRFCCDLWALEATYWTLAPFDGSLSVTSPAGLGTPLNDRQVEFGGETADDWFGNGALEHRLWRRNEFHDVEINAIRNWLAGGCDSAWSVGWLAGFRFFRFDENFTFASVQNGGSWSDPDTVAFLENRVTNNLWGFQTGVNVDYCLAKNVRVFATPKFGIYDNHITHYFDIHLGNGTHADTGSTGVPGEFPVSAHTDVVSFLAQFDLGLDWRFAERWSARVGYRVINVTAVALADHQFPQYLVDIPEISKIKTNGDLILHGAFAGLTYNY